MRWKRAKNCVATTAIDERRASDDERATAKRPWKGYRDTTEEARGVGK
jgi:hypothetical protein